MPNFTNAPALSPRCGAWPLTERAAAPGPPARLQPLVHHGLAPAVALLFRGRGFGLGEELPERHVEGALLPRLKVRRCPVDLALPVHQYRQQLQTARSQKKKNEISTGKAIFNIFKSHATY